MSDQVTMQESLREWVASWGDPDSVFNLSPLSVAGLAGVAFGTSVYLMSKPIESNLAIKDLDVNRFLFFDLYMFSISLYINLCLSAFLFIKLSFPSAAWLPFGENHIQA